jgi:hypothetical protein
MSFLSKLTEKLAAPKASESGQLKKIRAESERRRAAKSGLIPKIEGESIESAIDTLATRIEKGPSDAKP